MIDFTHNSKTPFHHHPIEDCDLIEYGDNKVKSFRVADFKYDNPTTLGYTFIIVQMCVEKKKLVDHAIFEAVLLDPFLYACAVADNYSGFIVKKHPDAYLKAKAIYLQDVEKYNHV